MRLAGPHRIKHLHPLAVSQLQGCGQLCITKTPSSGFPSNVTLLLPGRLRNPASSSLPHVADFNGIRHRWDLRDPQLILGFCSEATVAAMLTADFAYTCGSKIGFSLTAPAAFAIVSLGDTSMKSTPIYTAKATPMGPGC